MITVAQLVHDTVDAIRLLHKNERVSQALILLYAAIDSLAWLATDNAETQRADFIKWAEDYIVSQGSLPCTAEELYSARCGLLHTHAAESRGTTTGKARQLWYSTDSISADMLQYVAHDRPDVIIVPFGDLLQAFANGAEAFDAALEADPPRKEAAELKAAKWMAWVPAPPAA